MMWIKEYKKDIKELNVKVREIKGRLRNNWNLYDEGRDTGTDMNRFAALQYLLTVLYNYRTEKRNPNATLRLLRTNYYVDFHLGVMKVQTPSEYTAKYDKLLEEDLKVQAEFDATKRKRKAS